MSHIARHTVVDVSGVPAEILEEGLRVVGMMLTMEGVKVTDYFFNYDTVVHGKDYHDHNNRVILGLDPEGYGREGKFGGIGVSISDAGKLVFLGTSEQYDGRQANQARQTRLQNRVEELLPGAVYFAARAMLAKAQGKRAEVSVDPVTRELRLAVEA